ncbi:MAG: hypothetical protein IJ571_03625 [Ruminococcus sp.]|nr:hypothetical protein [Ruminococcus sp.]
MSNLGPYQDLTSAAKKAGGVDNYIRNIRNEGYQDGHDDGVIYGVILASVIGGVVLLSKKGIEIIKSRRKEVHENAETSKDILRQICDENPNNDTESESINEEIRGDDQL